MSDIEARIRAVLDDVHIESGRKDEHEAVVQRVLKAAQAPASGEVEPVVWLVKFKEYEWRFEFAEPYEKATNPEYWTDAFPVYTHPPAKVPEVLALCEQCHKEFSVPLESGGNATTDLLCNFCNCPHCNARNDLWIKLTTPTPATTAETEWVKLPHDVVINGGMTFRKGVKLSTFIKAAERWHREAMKQYAGISKEEIQALMHRPPTAQEQ